MQKYLTFDKLFNNIDDYINSLPDNTTRINIACMYLTYIPDLSRFTNLQYLDCSRNKLKQLPPLNSNLQKLNCSRNKLKQLPPLNSNLQKLNCSHNLLKQLPELNENLIILDCSNNLLTSLPTLNNDLEGLFCFNNLLKSLPPLNKKLSHLNCCVNELTWLPVINNELISLDCFGNKLYYLPNLNKISTIILGDNPLVYPFPNDFGLYNSHNFNLNKSVQIVNNFRFTYYALRFKLKFKKWLWEKVREPKIMKQFHPDYLTALKDNDDLEEFLEEWIKK